jgi:hypothetical protein
MTLKLMPRDRKSNAFKEDIISLIDTEMAFNPNMKEIKLKLLSKDMLISDKIISISNKHGINERTK